MAGKSAVKKKKQLTFEMALERLNTIIAELEAEGVSLDRSLELFAEGRRLAERCHDLLSEAEQKVKTLVKTAEGFREEPGLTGGGGKEER
jgi:exodeoxyribonuclease VII small subunit